MEDFNDNLERGLSLAEELRKYREGVGMKVEDVARETRISVQYIRALEAGDYRAFSARVYAQGTVRRMAKIFEGADADALVALCTREWDEIMGGGRTSGYPMRERNGTARPGMFFLTPRRMGILAAASFSLLLVVFLSKRLVAFAAPPALVVQSPADESGSDTSVVEVSGATEKESSLTVNGRELTLDQYGNFDEKIELPSGVSALQFISRNRFGKTQSVVRHIFVE